MINVICAIWAASIGFFAHSTGAYFIRDMGKFCYQVLAGIF